MDPNVDDATADARAPIDRRALIRRAAIAGAVAWTAPIIIESVVSPAGALTVGCGCYKAVLDASCTPTFQNNNDCSPTSALCTTVVPQNVVSRDYVPSDFCLSVLPYATLASSTTTCADPDPFRTGRFVIVTIGADCADCIVVAAQAKVVGRGGCEVSTIAVGGKTVTFDKGNTADLWKSFTLIIKCC